MAYTVEEAKLRLDQLLREAEEGKTVEITRDAGHSVRLVPVEEPVIKQRIPGRYAGQFQYSDEIFKPLETDEELREYGFDIMVDAKVIEPGKPDERVA